MGWKVLLKDVLKFLEYTKKEKENEYTTKRLWLFLWK